MALIKKSALPVNYSLILELTKRDFVERYAGSSLGFIWSFIYPLTTILIYMIIFGNIMGARLPGTSSVYSYGIYLVSGLVPWMAFSNTILRSSTVFLDKKYLISKIHLDLPTFPLFIVLSESITFVITMAVFMGILLFTGYVPSWHLILIPFIYIVQQVFSYALGFFLGIFVVFLKDLKEIVSIGLLIWFWFTPIVYLFEILPPFAQQVLLFNPALAFISAYHDIFIYHKTPSLVYLTIVLFIGCLLVFIDWIIFRKLEKDIRDII